MPSGFFSSQELSPFGEKELKKVELDSISQAALKIKAMNSRRIFVTGAAGFLGSYFAKWAVEQGYEVLGVDNLSLGHKNNIPDGVQFYEYDLIDIEKNNKLLKGVDYVFHSAAYPYDNFSLYAPFKITQNTFSITASVLSAALSNQVKRFIYCSSMSRYGNHKAPFTEDMPPKGMTPYAVSKIAGEDLIKSLAQVHSFEYVICIPHNIFGPQQVYNDPYRNAVSMIVNQMLHQKSPLIYGDGTQKRAFTPIQDLVSLFPALLFEPALKNQTLNIGPDEEVVSLNELVQIINKITGQNLKPHYSSFRKQEVKIAFCSADKARKLIHYQPKLSLQTALESLIDFIKSQGPSYFAHYQAPELKSPFFPPHWRESKATRSL